MMALNHVTLDPADARNILKYLADHQGLSPEEVRPIEFDAERRMVEYSYTADKVTSDTCSSCHAMARVLSERRTKEEWELLVAMHRGYYPLVDNQPMNGGQGFRRTRPMQTEPGPDGQPPDNRHPMDVALEHLEKTLPLVTSQWTAWSPAMQSPKLAGRWAVSGSLAGEGRHLRSGHHRRPIRALPTASPPRRGTRSRAPARRCRARARASSTPGSSGAAAARCPAARIPGAR